jgi:hypothetical protein
MSGPFKLGEAVTLEETYTHAGFTWRNYRLIKVMRTYNAGMDLLSYLPYPGGRVMQPHPRNRMLRIGGSGGADYWNRSNYFNDFSSLSGLLDAVRGVKIARPTPKQKGLN